MANVTRTELAVRRGFGWASSLVFTLWALARSAWFRPGEPRAAHLPDAEQAEDAVTDQVLDEDGFPFAAQVGGPGDENTALVALLRTAAADRASRTESLP